MLILNVYSVVSIFDGETCITDVCVNSPGGLWVDFLLRLPRLFEVLDGELSCIASLRLERLPTNISRRFEQEKERNVLLTWSRPL